MCEVSESFSDWSPGGKLEKVSLCTCTSLTSDDDTTRGSNPTWARDLMQLSLDFPHTRTVFVFAGKTTNASLDSGFLNRYAEIQMLCMTAVKLKCTLDDKKDAKVPWGQVKAKVYQVCQRFDGGIETSKVSRIIQIFCEKISIGSFVRNQEQERK